MKLYDQKISKHLSAVGGSLLTVCLYLLLTGILHTVLFAIDGEDSAYNTVFGIVSFILATLYWLVIGYVLFGRPGSTGRRPAMSYVFFCMLPIVVFTGVTLLAMYVFPTRDFLPSWNMMTWIVAPTLFWYLPFSYLYYMLGYYLSFPLFMGITLLIIAGVLTIGVILGMARRVRLAEHEEAVRRQVARSRAQKAQPAVSFETNAQEKKKKRPRTKPAYDKDDPFKDDEGSEQIIYTESFEPITDAMIAAENTKRARETQVVRTRETAPVKNPPALAQDTRVTPTHQARESDTTQVLPDVPVSDKTAKPQSDTQTTQVLPKAAVSDTAVLNTDSAAQAAATDKTERPEHDTKTTQVLPEVSVSDTAKTGQTALSDTEKTGQRVDGTQTTQVLPDTSEDAAPQYVPVAHKRKHSDKKPRWIFPGHGKDKQDK